MFQGGLSVFKLGCYFLLAILLSVTAAVAQGGEENKDWKLERGSKEWALEFGYAPMQPTFLSGREEYDTNGRKFILGSFRWGRVIGTAKGITFEYLLEAMPVAFAVRNEVANPTYTPDGRNGKASYSLRENTYGAAIHPAGFRFVFLPKKRLKPYVQTSAGFIFTRKPVPIPQSPNYNFSGDFGGGLMYSIDRTRTINFGYRYFHISNMNIGEINPGYNANIFYIGYSTFYK
jgi:opacity protein-like surface antigen